MHAESKVLMERFSRTVPKGVPVLDIGSRDVNGTFREFFPENPYTGIDIEEGTGVDIVVPPYEYPFTDNQWDVIISGSTLEHVKHPWRWMKEIARILKPGGRVCIIVPSVHPYHEHPVDCWRVYPEGLKALFEDFGLKTISVKLFDGSKSFIPGIGEIHMINIAEFHDTMGIAVK